MDGTLQEPHYRSLEAEQAEWAAAAVLARALRSGGAVSLLWHNNRFDPRVSRGYDEVYWKLLDQALAHGAVCGRAADIVARWTKATGSVRRIPRRWTPARSPCTLTSGTTP